MEIVFVILHYNTEVETENLVYSIEKHIDTNEFHIVIVDNNSPNGSGTRIKKQYLNNKNVSVILENRNLGFAKGNNVGIEFALSEFNPTYICCMNNDTLMIQKDFLSTIKKEYKRSKAALIGPLGYLKDNSLQYSAYKLRTIKDFSDELKKMLNDTIDDSNSDNFKSHSKCAHIYMKLRKTLHNVKFGFIKPGLYFRHEDVILHGSCIIMTPAFFEKERGFNPKTFLFREEELLYISLKKNSLLSVYNPKLKIKHLEDAATNSINADAREKLEFIRDNQVHSLQILIEELELME